MKKIITIIAIFLSAMVLGAQTALLFPGTGCSYADPAGGPSKNTGTISMFESLRDAYATFKDVDQPVLVGHSQGGSRSLALANYMAMQGKSAAGVISVGGPVKGYTPLTGGKAVIAGRINGVVGDLGRGVDAMLYALLYPSIGPLAGIPVVSFGAEIYGIWRGAKKTPNGADELVALALAGQIPENAQASAFGISNELIEDLTPGSEYTMKYLTPQPVDEAGHYASVEDGGYYSYIWTYTKVLGVKVWYWKLVWVIRYKTVWKPTTYKAVATPLLGNQTRVAYISGTNSNIKTFCHEMSAEAGAKWDYWEPVISTAGFLANSASAVCATYALLDGAAAITAYSVGLVPLGMFLTAKTVTDSYEAVNAAKAAKLLLDVDYAINTRIYNTALSDGFVTYDCTTLPLSATGGRSWTGRSGPDMDSKLMTHQRLSRDEEIWGLGGGMGKDPDKGAMPIQRGGLIETYLRAAYMNQAIIDDTKQKRFD
jgi:hypothetical protein